MPYDLVVRGGTVVDGTGLSAYRADVGIEGNRITAIGRITSRGQSELDADGLVVTPGFIDGHTHMDAQVFWDPLGTCSCYHGVTTAVMGHCGFTLAPSRPDERALVVRNLERAEDIPPEALAAGINWSWSSFSEYLDALDRLPKGINFAANIGHSALRTWAMGESAFERTATGDEIARMKMELRGALSSGAIGFSTSRSRAHETSDDRPVASRLADWSELTQLVDVLGEHDAVFQLASEPASMSPDPQVRGEYYSRLGKLLTSSQVQTAIPLLVNEHSLELTKFIDECSHAGARAFGLTHSRGISVLLSFKTKLPYDGLPEWKEMRSKPLSDQRRLLSTPELRRKLVHAAHHGAYGRAIGAEARKPDYEQMRILDRLHPPYRNLAEVARERGMDPVDLLIDMSIESDFEQFFFQPLHDYDEPRLEQLMKYPRGVMTFSDAGAHVSQICDFSIQTHLLSYWVRERQAFSLEEAVRMITVAPARAWNIADRGLLREGMVADMNVFDPRSIACEMPKIVNDLPAGAKRIVQKAKGIRATIVAGKVVLRDGAHTGALPGQLIRQRRS